MRTTARHFALLLLSLATACAGLGGDPAGGGGGSGVDAGASGGWNDAGGGYSPDGGPGGGNISLGGAQDFGYFRRLLDDGQVPHREDFDAAGFFAEHYLTLPPPDCGKRVCLQTLFGAMPSLLDGAPMNMVQIGLNTPVTIDPGDRPPLTLAIAIDVSGSMDVAGKIDYVRTGLVTLIDNLRDDDQIALVTYSDNARIVAPMGPVGTRRDALRSIASELVASGSTNFYDGLDTAFKQVQAVYDLDRQNRVIVLSDGEPTAGNTDENAIMTMSAGYNQSGLGLTTIGLGTDFNATLMRGLAEQGNGNHYFLESSSAVEEVFTEELAYFTVPVAFDVLLRATTGPDYQLLGAHGSSFWTPTSYGGYVEVPSVFLSHRVSGNDTGPGGGRRGGGSALLLDLAPMTTSVDPNETQAVVSDVNVMFRAPGDTTTSTDRVILTYPNNPIQVPATGFWLGGDSAVAIAKKSFVMLNVYLGLERACSSFYDSGAASPQMTDVIGQLMRVKAAVLDYEAGLTDGDADMLADAELVQKLIDVLMVNGAEAPADPQIPADPWPAD